jgi:uncharacterized protein (DUF924 family)
VYAEVLAFWFDETPPKTWWTADPEFDSTVERRFGPVHRAAVRGELYAWRSAPEGRLAEVIVLDQFSRNLFRGRPEAFAADPMALVLAQEAVAGGHDQVLEPTRRSFLYMPYMHSESRAIHAVAVPLFAALEMPDSLRFELHHKSIVDRFGRYPHRNAILGRPSTAEELAFLEQPGSRF